MQGTFKVIYVGVLVARWYKTLLSQPLYTRDSIQAERYPSVSDVLWVQILPLYKIYCTYLINSCAPRYNWNQLASKLKTGSIHWQQPIKYNDNNLLKKTLVGGRVVGGTYYLRFRFFGPDRAQSVTYFPLKISFLKISFVNQRSRV